MVQILATLGLFFIITGFIEAELEGRHIEPHFLFTNFFKNVFFIYLLYKWLGTFM